MNHLSILPGQDGKRFQVAADRFSSLYVILDTVSGAELAPAYPLNSTGYQAAYSACNALNYEDAEAAGVEAERELVVGEVAEVPCCELCGEPAVLVGEQWTCPACSPSCEPAAAPAPAAQDYCIIGGCGQLATEVVQQGPDYVCYCAAHVSIGQRIVARRAALEAPAPVTDAPITPTFAQLDAALLARQEDAEQGARRAKDVCDPDLAKLATNSANAYRKARALLAVAEAEQQRLAVVTPSGDLLVRSGSRGGIWHSVARRPLDGSDYSPITCSCDHGQAGKFGICWHVALAEGWADAVELSVAERDASADARASFGLAA